MHFLLAFCLIFVPALSYSQLDSILALQETDQIIALLDVYENLIQTDKNQVPGKLKEFEVGFKRKKAKLLSQEVWSLQQLFEIENLTPNDSLKLHKAILVLAEVQKRGWPVQEVDWILRIGKMLYGYGRFEEAYSYFILGERKIKKLDIAMYPHLAIQVVSIGHWYYQQSYYEDAVNVFRYVLPHHKYVTHDGVFGHILNALGLSYHHLAEYDSAVVYFKKGWETAFKDNKDTLLGTLIQGNCGISLVRLGREDEAIELFEEDIRVSKLYNAYSSATYASLEVIPIYLKRGNFAAAETHFEYVFKHFDRKNLRALEKFYSSLFLKHRYLGNSEEAFRYLDSTKIIRDSINAGFNADLLLQVKQRVDAEVNLAEMALLESERKHQWLLKNLILATAILICSFLVFLYYKQRNTSRKTIEIKTLKAQMAENELIQAKKELLLFTEVLKEKNSLIERLDAEYQKTQEQLFQPPFISPVNTFAHMSILTEEDWQEFRRLFDKAFPGFFLRLKNKYPELTPSDVRHIALTKLHLTSGEMSKMLGVSYDAIKKSRYRLRNRINLPLGTNLEQLVESI